ncbi:hypothetical protein [Paracraurococcus lichenis]|uniref:Uncharacterized protein n=1 Tax=Paracraurococcus lichenis TaxID=3064888 RepID=A0ABT9E573_9PROT|nr:hypothetical protein [Paracraurococcus sp. LOR1-02]MDO9711311.1 hypothetical protein [Paracraurococcus sp. LOR1-02]
MDGTGVLPEVPGPDPMPRRINDAPLRAALENRRGRAYDETISGVCYTHGVRLGLAGEALPDWMPTAPRWAREALRAGHASGTAISGRKRLAG